MRRPLRALPESQGVTFVEVESVADPATLAQHTRVYRTTWKLTQETIDRVTTFRIGSVQRQGPLARITTPGQVRAGALTRVEVTDPDGRFGLSSAEIVASSGSTGASLRAPGSCTPWCFPRRPVG